MTTSPVESLNNVTKHGKHGISKRMSIDKSTDELIKGINERFRKRDSKVKDGLIKNEYSSMSPLKNFLEPVPLALSDQFFDARKFYKLARMSARKWICWFDHSSDLEPED